MKDFIKWLGVNEKVAKVVVWIMIIMTMLILTNTMLDSIGFPHYQITYKNIKEIISNDFIETLLGLIVCILNFFCIIFMVFRVYEFKNIIKYSIIYVVLNWVVTEFSNYAVAQLFIIVFIIILCFIYSGKNWKYIIYGILSILLNVIIQTIIYTFKMNLIDK